MQLQATLIIEAGNDPVEARGVAMQKLYNWLTDLDLCGHQTRKPSPGALINYAIKPYIETNQIKQPNK